MTIQERSKIQGVEDVDHRVFSDQLVKLLSDNQVFLNKIQKAQWSFEIFSKNTYDAIVSKLSSSAEIIAKQLRKHQGFVPANLEVYLEVSELEEHLQTESEIEVAKDLILSHKHLLDYLLSFSEDDLYEYQEERRLLLDKLHDVHAEVFRLLEVIA